LTAGTDARAIFRAWLWFDYKFAMYGWVPVAIAPLAWDFGLERGSAQGQRMVHAQAADFFAGGPGGTDAALAGTRRSATATVSRDDRQISATARGLGMGRAGGRGAVVLRRRITRLTFGHGKTLSVDSIGALVAVLTMNIVGWSITCGGACDATMGKSPVAVASLAEASVDVWTKEKRNVASPSFPSLGRDIFPPPVADCQKVSAGIHAANLVDTLRTVVGRAYKSCALADEQGTP
jgi:hypothetical protein